VVAQSLLGEMYETGKGVRQDYVQAYKLQMPTQRRLSRHAPATLRRRQGAEAQLREPYWKGFTKAVN
jgi:hypothetical protein